MTDSPGILGKLLSSLVTTSRPLAIAVAAFYLNHKLPPAYRTHRAVWYCALASTVILLAAAAMSGYGLARKLSEQPSARQNVVGIHEAMSGRDSEIPGEPKTRQPAL